MDAHAAVRTLSIMLECRPLAAEVLLAVKRLQDKAECYLRAVVPAGSVVCDP